MTFREWVILSGASPSKLAVELDCARPHVYRLMAASSMPRRQMIEAIDRVTGGQVTTSDLIGAYNDHWAAQCPK